MSRGRTRSRSLAVLLALGGVGVLARLVELQVFGAEEWTKERARNQRELQWLPPARGRICDRWDRPLAEDETSFVLSVLYRRFRREHPVAVLLHLDHFVRELHEACNPAPAPLLAEPLRYGDDLERFHAGVAAMLAMPAQWLHPGGALPRKLREVLRFYVFGGVARGVPHSDAVRLAVAFDRRHGAAPTGSVGDSLAPIAGLGPAALEMAVREAIDASHRDLVQLEDLLGNRLRLAPPWRRPADFKPQTGTLRAHLDALDVRLGERAADRLAKPAAGAEEPGTGSLWDRLVATWLSTTPLPNGEPSLVDRAWTRFALENAPFEICKPVPFDPVVTLVLGAAERFPGFVVGERVRRVYPRRESGERPYRFLGTVTEREDDTARPELLLVPDGALDEAIDPTTQMNMDDRTLQEWKRRLEEDAKLLRRAGGSGLELELDAVLTGEIGLREILHDRRGRELQSPRHVAAEQGLDVRLTIDADIQDLMLATLREEAAAYAADARKTTKDRRLGVRATLVLLDAVRGDIYGMCWLPEVAEVPGHGLLPFRLNTAVRAAHQAYPGSLVKPFIACEGLVQSVEGSGDWRPCEHGLWRDGHRILECECQIGERRHDVQNALTYSCNAYFGQVGERLGFDGVRRALARFDLWLDDASHVAPLGLAIDRPGPVPNERWSIERRAIGYGYRMAPILLARAYAALGTGRLPALRLVDAVAGIELDRAAGVDLGLTADALRPVRKGLAAVTGEGTARKAKLGDWDVSAKTGTAIVQEGTGSNAWFAGYLPRESPRLAFCCVLWDVDRGVHGGDAAAPIVRRLLEKMYLDAGLRDRYLPWRKR